MTPHGWWVRCFQCGHQVDLTEVQRRRAATGEEGIQLWWGWRPVKYIHYQIVDMCPGCSAQEEAVERTTRRRQIVLIGGTGLGLVAWFYAGVMGLVGVVVVIVGSLFLRRRPRSLYLLKEGRNP